jgi:3-methyl-2-oxobutanoate hydroxymethyltransferase
MAEQSKWNVRKIRALKGERKISVLTAYDYLTAKIVDAAGIQIILVGDSLGMTVLGYENTLPVTMDDMLHHSAAVARGVSAALLVADMPFLSYQCSQDEALRNAGRFLKEAGVDAVKIEGGERQCALIERLVESGIPVMGHLGLTPQSVKAIGYAVQGGSEAAAERLRREAKLLEQAGVFALVLESIPAALAAEISAAVAMPTIGIGAGPGCDGQVLVVQDMLGMYEEIKPRFVKRYAALADDMRRAVAEYRKEVEAGTFPGKEHSY